MTPFRYDIKNPDIMKDLLAQGFTICNATADTWTLEAPSTISSTKARKLISICIKLYGAAKELSKANKRYYSLVEEINRINLSR